MMPPMMPKEFFFRCLSAPSLLAYTGDVSKCSELTRGSPDDRVPAVTTRYGFIDPLGELAIPSPHGPPSPSTKGWPQ